MLINNLPYRFIGDCICKLNKPFSLNIKSLIILALDFVFMLVLIKILPFSAQENRGLALLIFIGILWLTEAF